MFTVLLWIWPVWCYCSYWASAGLCAGHNNKNFIHSYVVNESGSSIFTHRANILVFFTIFESYVADTEEQQRSINADESCVWKHKWGRRHHWNSQSCLLIFVGETVEKSNIFKYHILTVTVLRLIKSCNLTITSANILKCRHPYVMKLDGPLRETHK